MWKRALFLALLVSLVVPNWVAWNQVRAMTTFVPGGTRTPRPEELSWSAKAEVIVRGVRLPRPENLESPADHGLLYTSWSVPVPDGEVLEVWTVPGGEKQALLFHGYGGHKDQLLDVVPWFRARGYTVHLVDFPGSGGSTGNQTSLGEHEAEDVAASVRAVAAKHPGPIVLYGFSMGGAAVLGALADHDLPVRAAIVDCVYDRLANTVGRRFEAMGLPARPGTDLLLFWGSWHLGSNAWAIAPVDDAARVDVPVLVFSGVRDPRVDRDEARHLASALPDGRLVEVDGGHAPAFRDEAVWDEAVTAFLAGPGAEE